MYTKNVLVRYRFDIFGQHSADFAYIFWNSIKSCRVRLWGISRLGSVFIFLRWYELKHFYIQVTCLIGVGAGLFFASAKEFCPNFPKLTLKKLQKLPPKKRLHFILFWAHFFQIKAHQALILPKFPSNLPKFPLTCPKKTKKMTSKQKTSAFWFFPSIFTKVSSNFAKVFTHFSQISADFAGFCADFYQIKTFGGELLPPAPPPPTLLTCLHKGGGFESTSKFYYEKIDFT